MNIDPNEAEEVFDDFLISMDDQLDWLIAEAENITSTLQTHSTHLKPLKIYLI